MRFPSAPAGVKRGSGLMSCGNAQCELASMMPSNILNSSLSRHIHPMSHSNPMHAAGQFFYQLLVASYLAWPGPKMHGLACAAASSRPRGHSASSSYGRLTATPGVKAAQWCVHPPRISEEKECPGKSGRRRCWGTCDVRLATVT